MIAFPKDKAALADTRGAIRAGGTDLAETRRLGLSAGDIVDLRDTAGLDAIAWDPGVPEAPPPLPSPAGDPGAPASQEPPKKGKKAEPPPPPPPPPAPRPPSLTIGAKVRVAALASHPDVVRAAPALALAAGALATPQIRAQATVAGNLLQRNRCAYFRHHAYHCLKKGGGECFARTGDDAWHAVFDRGPCAAVHASTLGMALLLYDAEVELLSGKSRTIALLYGDGSDPTRDHQLEDDAVITAIHLVTAEGERGSYLRATHRVFAEWPAVEAGARLVVADGVVKHARVAIGGVAPVPLRLPAVEAKLVGAGPDAFAAAAKLAIDGANPVSGSAWKLPVVVACVEDALTQAWGTS